MFVVTFVHKTRAKLYVSGVRTYGKGKQLFVYVYIIIYDLCLIYVLVSSKLVLVVLYLISYITIMHVYRRFFFSSDLFAFIVAPL